MSGPWRPAAAGAPDGRTVPGRDARCRCLNEPNPVPEWSDETVTSMMPDLVHAILGQAAAGEAAQIRSVWDFVVRGGVLMIPIGLCSLIALGVIVERVVSLRQSRILPRGFIDGLKAALDGPDGREKALAYCATATTPVAEIFQMGIKRLGESIDLLERHVQEAGERVVDRLRRHLRILAVIGSIAPLLGLLGTIFGMIEAFQTVAESSEALGKTELLASGIYQALITTAAGLIVAIPVVFSYHLLGLKIDRIVDEVDRATLEFVEHYALEGNGHASLRLRTENGHDAATKAAAT